MVKRFKRFSRRRRFNRAKNKRIVRLARRTFKRMAETKFLFSTLVDLVLRATPSITTWNLEQITQGTGPFNRIGQQIQIKRLSLRVCVEPFPGTGGNVHGTFRVMILYPRKACANDYLAGDMALGWAGYPDPYKWIVIKDKFIDLGLYDEGSYSGGNPTRRTWSWSKRMNLKINWSGDQVIREPQIVLYSSFPNGTATYMNVLINKRVSFIDC